MELHRILKPREAVKIGVDKYTNSRGLRPAIGTDRRSDEDQIKDADIEQLGSADAAGF